MKLSYIFLLSLVTFAHAAFAAAPVDSIPADFHITALDSGTLFEADLPPLAGTVGGREPFYTYLWNFGDGHFSFRESPVHRYANAGEYTATLYAVNNYDDGPRPRRRPKNVHIASVNSSSPSISPAEQHFFTSNGIFQIAKNTNALPGQGMTLIVGVKHPGKGKVFLLTNEKIYGTEGLRYAGQSTYNQEQILPAPSLSNLQGLWASVSHATLTFSGSPDYGIKKEFNFQPEEAISYFSDLYDSYKTISNYKVESPKGSPQFSFINLEVTPEMLADTNAIVTITGVYIPEEGSAIIHQVEVPVVTSHDPNKMAMKYARMSYRRLSKNKKLIYKIQFQNDGEGDAKNIRLEMSLPKQADPSTFKLLSLYPYCDSCLSKEEKGCWKLYSKGEDTLVFHFKDISLPGRQAEDITDSDSTKGFIRFSIETNKKLKNKPFHARTKIFFDKNEPISTNHVTGRFRKGFSPIIFAGYSGFMPTIGHSGMTYKEEGMLGIGLAPIAPYKKLYFQFEVYANLSRYRRYLKQAGKEGLLIIETPTGQQKEIRYSTYDKSFESNNLNIRVVPLHLRYNFNSFISAGIGALTEFKMNLDATEDRIYILTDNNLSGPIRRRYGDWVDAPGKKVSVKAFLDLTVGKVYLGPSLGFRYYYGGTDRQHLNVYLAWRL